MKKTESYKHLFILTLSSMRTSHATPNAYWLRLWANDSTAPVINKFKNREYCARVWVVRVVLQQIITHQYTHCHYKAGEKTGWQPCPLERNDAAAGWHGTSQSESPAWTLLHIRHHLHSLQAESKRHEYINKSEKVKEHAHCITTCSKVASLE